MKWLTLFLYIGRSRIWKHGCYKAWLSLTQPFCSFFACPKKERKKGHHERQLPRADIARASPNKGPAPGQFAPFVDVHALLAQLR